MRKFIENTLHQKIELANYEKLEKLPLIFQASYELYTMKMRGQCCLLAKPKQEVGLVTLRKQQKYLEHVTGMFCVLYLTKMNFYSREKMLEEGISFIWEERQIYMPFLGILLSQKESRELKPCSQVSFLTQKLLLSVLYYCWKNTTVTIAADYLNVSKMSITRCFDEIESLEIPVLEKKGKTRMISCEESKRNMWERIKPYMRSPLIKEYYLADDITPKLRKSGISALAEFSMLADNDYPTYAIIKSELRDCGLKEKKQVPVNELPGCVVQELGYLIPFQNGNSIDPLTVFLLLEGEKKEPRVDMALEKMLEDYVW